MFSGAGRAGEEKQLFCERETGRGNPGKRGGEKCFLLYPFPLLQPKLGSAAGDPVILSLAPTPTHNKKKREGGRERERKQNSGAERSHRRPPLVKKKIKKRKHNREAGVGVFSPLFLVCPPMTPPFPLFL